MGLAGAVEEKHLHFRPAVERGGGEVKIKHKIQFTGFNFEKVEAFVGGDCGKDSNGNTVVATKKGPLIIQAPCEIVKGTKGIFFIKKL